MRVASTVLPALVASMLLLPPASARAQRNGDVSGGFNNQPTTGEVRSRERAAGVQPPPAARERRDDAVDNIYHDLMSRERSRGATSAPADPDAAAAARRGTSAPR